MFNWCFTLFTFFETFLLQCGITLYYQYINEERMTEKTTSFKSTITERAMIERLAQKFDRSLTWVIIESIRQLYKRTFGGAK